MTPVVTGVSVACLWTAEVIAGSIPTRPDVVVAAKTTATGPLTGGATCRTVRVATWTQRASDGATQFRVVELAVTA